MNINLILAVIYKKILYWVSHARTVLGVEFSIIRRKCCLMQNISLLYKLFPHIYFIGVPECKDCVLQLNTARIMMTKILLPFSWQRKKLISLPVHENVTSLPDQCFALTSIAFTRLMLCPDFHCFYQILFFIVVLAAAFLTSFIDSSGFCIFSVILSLTVRCTSRDHTFQEIFICV